MKLSQTLFVCFVLGVVSMLGGCVVTLDMVLSNESSSNLSVNYDSGYSSQIRVGETSKENYGVACIRITSGGVTREFQPDQPPDDFVEIGLFSTKIEAVYTKENRLVLLHKDEPNAKLELNNHCN